MFNAENELKKWAPVLEHADAAPITDPYKKAVTAKLLENTEKAIQEERAHSSFELNESTQSAGSISTGSSFDPILISLVRRAMPNLIAYDTVGVQPMSGPTGLIFALEPRMETASAAGTITSADHAPFAPGNEPGTTAFAGAAANVGEIGDAVSQGASNFTDVPGTGGGGDLTDGTQAASEADFGVGGGLTLAGGETQTTPEEAGFTISKTTVTAQTRQLKAEYTMELAQDLKAVHGLDAETELANILSGEILGEINREVIRGLGREAKYADVADGSIGLSAAGASGTQLQKALFSVSAGTNGRWKQEIFQSLAYEIEKQANNIGVDTRRGKGNFVVCSANVASALAGAGNLKFGGAGELTVDSQGNTFAGTLNGSLKVYVDPYATKDYVIVGYKGASSSDAGFYYCPYVPLTMVRAVGEDNFQPKIAFKTRYGIARNPFVNGGAAGAAGSLNINPYYRIFGVGGL
jgi:hypothetical protein